MLTTMTLAMTLLTPADTAEAKVLRPLFDDTTCVTRVITRDAMTQAMALALDTHRAKGCDIMKSQTEVRNITFVDGTKRTLFIITQESN